MRLNSLQIENFGIYRKRDIQFDSGPVVLIYGPNGAGKSTLLHLIRNALFGFPARSDFNFEQGAMAVTVDATLADGRPVCFRRRKGNKNVVQGWYENENRLLDESTLSGLIGPMDSKLYNQIFGFALEELSQGESSLKGTPLTEALMSSTMGGANVLKQLAANLQNNCNDIFLPRGSKRLNKLISEADEHQKQYQQSIVVPREYKQWVSELECCEEEIVRQEREAEQRRRERMQLDRILKAIPIAKSLAGIDQRITDLQLPVEVQAETPADRYETWTQLLGAQTQQQKEVRELELQVRDNFADLQQLVIEEPFLSNRDLLFSLNAEVPSILAARKTVAALDKEQQDLQSVLTGNLRQLKTDIEQLQVISATDTTTNFKELSNKLSNLEKAQTARTNLEVRLRDEEQLLDKIASQISAAHPAPLVATLTELLEELRLQIEQQNRRDEAELARAAQVRQLTEREQPLLREIGAKISTLRGARLPLPKDASLLQTQLKEAADESRTARKDLQKLQKQIADLQKEIDALEDQQKLPSTDALEQAIADRDSTADQLAKLLFESENLSAEYWLRAGGRFSHLKQAIEKVDRLFQLSMDLATQIAKRNQKLKNLSELKLSLDPNQGNLLEKEAAEAKVKESWMTLWQEIAIPVESSDQMIQWLSTASGLAVQWKQFDQSSASEAAPSETATLEVLLGKIGELVPEIQGLSPERAFKALDRTLATWREESVRREQQQIDINRRQEQLSKLRGDYSIAVTNREEIARQIQDGLEQLKLVVPAEVIQARETIELWEQTLRHYRRIGQIASELQGAKAIIDDFNHRSEPLRSVLLHDGSLSGIDTTSLLADWLRRADSAVAQDVARIKLRAKQENLQQQLRLAEEKLNKTVGEIEAIVQRLKVSSIDAAEKLLRSYQELSNLQLEWKTQREKLAIISDGQSIDEFLIEVRAIAESDALQRIKKITENESILGNSIKDLAVERSTIQEKIQRLRTDESLETLEAKFQSDQAMIASLTEQWMVARIARSLLDQTLARFEREHQPAMIKLVNPLLSKLTEGNYVAVQGSSRTDESFSVVNRDGDLVKTDALSTGNREQLFLAMRLAYMQYYCQDREPMPMVLDDCLVNFDDKRAKITIQTLVEMFPKGQAIVLTCHERMIAIMKGIDKKLPVIRLDSPPMLF